ncbi:hypothetical protein BJ170DRAFT_108414 [Xylariales sp. AK1849]|nr:hypothetical protein BJ170DRAFT_108414 [Xylariales sp. AK1849]
MADGPGPNSAADVDAEEATRVRAATEPTQQIRGVQKQRKSGEPAVLDDFVRDAGDEYDNFVPDSLSHWDPEPGFSHVDGDIGGPGYNETKVDIIAIPCIGASPVETWTRDPLPDGYFGFPPQTELGKYPTVKELPGSSILSPAITRHLPKAKHLWVRQGIRREVNTARVLLYRHRELNEDVTLDQMADDLLESICRLREGQTRSRPLFFICHSIGGLVAKLALVKASRREDLRWIIFDCHGMTFFGTPHRGSSYLSMPNLRESIQHLLFLSKPLPRSITEALRLNHRPLLTMHDLFTDIASEMHIWTFYETIDSQLSGLGTADFDEVHFSAPLASIKSSLLGVRHEQAFSIDNDHVHCASFGPNNIQTMHSFLEDLGQAVRKAERLSSSFVHTPLKLADNVKMELIGFYDDPDPNTVSDVRLYVSKHYLNEFLDKGPERCLQERLNTVAPKLHRQTLPPSQVRAASSGGTGNLGSGALGIWNNVQDFGQRIFSGSRPRSSPQSPERDGVVQSPEIVVTGDSFRPSVASHHRGRSAPAVSPSRSRGLTVPPLSTPGFHHPASGSSSQSGRTDSDETARTLSESTGNDISPLSTDPARQLDHGVTQDSTPGSDEQNFDRATKSHKERVTRATALQDLTAGFSRPDPNRRKFMWIHLPHNNPQWVKSIFDTLAEKQHQSFSRLLRNENWVNRHVQGRHAQAHSSYVRPGCGFVPADSHSPRPSSPSASGRTSPALNAPTYLYLYLPYLHFDTYINLVRRRNLIRRRMGHGRARPVPKDVADLESLELRVIWEYVGHDPPFNTRRTLDQYGYPSLRDTYARDDDQMMYKLTKERVKIPFNNRRGMYGTRAEKEQSATSPAARLASAVDAIKPELTLHAQDESPSDIEEDVLDGNVLMVDQLWLWAVDTATLTTFFPKRESHPTEGPMFQQADLRNSVYNELNGDLTGRCENGLDLAAFITLHAVTVLLDRTSHPDLEIFRIFEEAIGVLTERMTSSLKRFRMQTFKDRIHDSSESEDDDLEDNRSQTIKKRHKRELEHAERENRENTSALLELRDMDDELSTMKSLFAEQTTVVQKLRELYDKPELTEHTHNGRMFLDEALSRLEDYNKQVTDMMARIDTTRKDYEKLLEMVQRQAQVDEVRWSRLQTELASTQNLSVMIFTTFTVIFLPLSFFTGLFGMNTKEWGGGDDNFLSLVDIGAIALPASAFLVAMSLVAAFSSRVQSVFKFVFKAWRHGAENVKDRYGKVQPKKQKEAKLVRKRLKHEREKVSKSKKERGYDFWETVRLERRSEYQIPDLNRITASQRSLARRGTSKRGFQRDYSDSN